VNVEHEVNRLLERRALPKLPRTTSELTLALGRGLTDPEHRLRNEASRMGGVMLASEMEDLLLSGASVEDLRAHLDQAADELMVKMQTESGSAGAEAARILADRARTS
jgi:hypothetical protein